RDQPDDQDREHRRDPDHSAARLDPRLEVWRGAGPDRPAPRYLLRMDTRRQLTAIAGSAAAVAAATGLVYALRPIAPTLSLGVLYTLAVLTTAVLFGLGFAIAAALASMLAFNFLFLAPVGTLTLADGRNWTALCVYVVTAIVASELA